MNITAATGLLSPEDGHATSSDMNNSHEELEPFLLNELQSNTNISSNILMPSNVNLNSNVNLPSNSNQELINHAGSPYFSTGISSSNNPCFNGEGR